MSKMCVEFGKLEIQVFFSDGARDKLVTVLRLHGITKDEAKERLSRFKFNNPAIEDRSQAFWQAEREWI